MPFLFFLVPEKIYNNPNIPGTSKSYLFIYFLFSLRPPVNKVREKLATATENNLVLSAGRKNEREMKLDPPVTAMQLVKLTLLHPWLLDQSLIQVIF